MDSTLPVSSARARVDAFVCSRPVQHGITALIVLNAITLGLETSPTVVAATGGFLYLLDQVIVAVFAVEIALRLYARGWRFFRSGWNWFDFIIVGVTLLPAVGNLSVLRTLRILRVLRLVSIVPSMRKVVGALLAAIPGLGSIALLLLLVYYVAAVMATKLFGQEFPEWFGSIGASMYSLFQIMTLESWSMGIVRPVMEPFPYAWLFFVPFILVTSFAVLNLFIAIIVDTMQTMHAAETREIESTVHAEAQEIERVVHDETGGVLAELRALRSEVTELRRELAAVRTRE